MQSTKVELHIGSAIEQYVREIAQDENRSLEAVLEDSLKLLFSNSADGEASEDLLVYCSDEQLWNLVHLRLTFAQDRRIRRLMDLGREDKLSLAEHREMESLLSLIDRQTLLRSQALLLLQERGHRPIQYMNVELAAT